MARQIVTILVILVSWSGMLYASQQDCSDYQKNVPKTQYDELLKQIQEKVKISCTKEDITCLMFTAVGNIKHYCALVKIPSEKGATTDCIVKWESSGHGASSASCDGNAFSTRGSVHMPNSFPFNGNAFPFNRDAFPFNTNNFLNQARMMRKKNAFQPFM